MSILFTTNKNYMKHKAFELDEMDKPDNLNGTTFNYESSKTINHNLGYVPLVRAYYDYNGAGTIFPTTGQRGIQTAFGPTLNYWFYIDEITTQTVTFRAESFSTQSGTFPFYYKIYYDYEE